MSTTSVEWTCTVNCNPVPLSELADSCGMSEVDLDELVDYCALVPLDLAQPKRVFSPQWVTPLRAVRKLQVDFDLDIFTVAIVLGNLRRIDVLERQVHSLKAQMPARSIYCSDE
jgi:chaperone modulatory protein CbpM